MRLPKLFMRASPLMVASKELEVARLALLEALTGKEYAESIVSFNAARIKRLEAYISTYHQDNS